MPIGRKDTEIIYRIEGSLQEPGDYKTGISLHWNSLSIRPLPKDQRWLSATPALYLSGTMTPRGKTISLPALNWEIYLRHLLFPKKGGCRDLSGLELMPTPMARKG